jgi:AcrR family transcriptional regulator
MIDNRSGAPYHDRIMGIAERKERQKTELRERILMAALRIIRDDGFAALTMRRIAEAVEYSPAALYLHFSSRDEIALALVRDGFAKLVAHMAPAMYEEDPLARVDAIGRAYLDFAQREPETYRLIFMEDERFASPIMLALKDSDDDAGDTAFGFLHDTVRELIDRGIYRPLNAQAVAALLWSSLHGIAALKISCPSYPFEGSIAEPGELLMDILTRGLLA